MGEITRVDTQTNAGIGIYFDRAKGGWIIRIYQDSIPQAEIVATTFTEGVLEVNAHFSGRRDAKRQLGDALVEQAYREQLERLNDQVQEPDDA
jgi:hypothetical protein